MCCPADKHAEEEHVTGWRRLLHLNSTTARREPLKTSLHDAHSRAVSPSTASPCKWPLRARNPGVCICQAYLAVKLAGPLSAKRNLSFAL